MQLLVVRHGEAEARAPLDSQRNLTPRGRDMVAQLGAAIIQKNFMPGQIWASPYVRAQQTAQILHRQLAPVDFVRECPVITPDSNVHDCLTWLQRVPESESLMLVSHQPFVTQLISWLCHASLQPDASVPSLTTSAAVLLQLDSVDAGCARIVWQLFPPLFDSRQG